MGNIWRRSTNTQREKFKNVQLNGSVYPSNSCYGVIRHWGAWEGDRENTLVTGACMNTCITAGGQVPFPGHMGPSTYGLGTGL